MFEDNNTREAIILSVHDGDTFDVEVKLGFDVKRKIRIRLSRINAPEVFGAEKFQGLVSKTFVEDNFLNKKVQVIDKRLDTRRTIVDVYVDLNDSQTNLSNLLVTQNFAIYETFK